MKSIKIILFPILLLLLAFTPEDEFSEVINPKALLEKLKQIAHETHSIESDFKELKYISVLNEPQHASGKMYYKQEDKMKWAQKSPFEYIILINGEDLKIKDDGKVYDKGGLMASRINKFMIGLIEGDYQDNRAYSTRFFKSDNQYMIELIPEARQLSQVYSKLKLYFSTSDYRLQGINFYEANGDRREVKFFNQVYNKNIADSVFQNL